MISMGNAGFDRIRKELSSVLQCGTWLGTCQLKVRCFSCLAIAVAWQESAVGSTIKKTGEGKQCKSVLPSKDLEWYFFSPRDRKYPNGSRTNRATKAGYWKATGKDRNVNSQLCAVGTKKTLVYHTGRAPHGSRTGWVMHEYRLHERECHDPSGLQDAYALCRVFKKTNPVTPKFESRYAIKNVNQMSSIGASCTEIYSEGRYDEWDSLEYSVPVKRCATSMNLRSPLHDDGQWIQYSENDEGESSFPTPVLNNGMTANCPPKADFTLERARLQQHSTLPIEITSHFRMHQSPSFTGRLGNEVEIMEDIFSVSQASKDFVNQSEAHAMLAYAWNDNHQDPIFSGMDSWEDPMAKPIEVHDAGHYQSAVNCSELIVLPADINYKKIDDPEFDAIPAENVPAYRLSRENVEGEVGNELFMSYLDDIKVDDFHFGFLTDGPSKKTELYDDNVVDSDFPCSSSFELLEEVEVKQGSCVSTRRLAETQFHQVLPSNTVRVHVLLQPRAQRDKGNNMKRPPCLSSSICPFQGSLRMNTEEEIQFQSEQGMSTKIKSNWFVKRIGCSFTVILALCRIWETIACTKNS